MQLLALFCILAVAHGAPYVHHEEASTVNPDPTENTETGPQMRKMNGETNSNLFRDLFSFMDVLMDPQSYTNPSEVCIFIDA